MFVFGSNLGGFHGRGAALLAKELYGAEQLTAVGITGRCYAIPTKDRFIRTLALFEIKRFVQAFAAHTHSHPEKKFFVTRIGCGYARLSNLQMAPLFAGCNTNCSFPEQWRPLLR